MLPSTSYRFALPPGSGTICTPQASGDRQAFVLHRTHTPGLSPGPYDHLRQRLASRLLTLHSYHSFFRASYTSASVLHCHDMDLTDFFLVLVRSSLPSSLVLLSIAIHRKWRIGPSLSSPGLIRYPRRRTPTRTVVRWTHRTCRTIHGTRPHSQRSGYPGTRDTMLPRSHLQVHGQAMLFQ